MSSAGSVCYQRKNGLFRSWRRGGERCCPHCGSSTLGDGRGYDGSMVNGGRSLCGTTSMSMSAKNRAQTHGMKREHDRVNDNRYTHIASPSYNSSDSDGCKDGAEGTQRPQKHVIQQNSKADTDYRAEENDVAGVTVAWPATKASNDGKSAVCVEAGVGEGRADSGPSNAATPCKGSKDGKTKSEAHLDTSHINHVDERADREWLERGKPSIHTPAHLWPMWDVASLDWPTFGRVPAPVDPSWTTAPTRAWDRRFPQRWTRPTCRNPW